ncbi:catalase [Ktedonospora formicarum]|uniref:Catalase n=1 Tax=Ktedonospora formicarum TaxID=2778364 RepID=A0A8J3IB86_9CHLR|nr:catalase [Ktedonospora formicarum]GHO49462.1 vegetative catalase [Ktedonospora formicarum]
MAEKDQHYLTTDSGIPAPDNTNSLTVGYPGPTLLEDFHLVEKLAHFNRERIPERIVHAKGAGAHGYFELTHDQSAYTKAAFLNGVGKKTPLFIRFSTVGGEKGSADSARDPRGFAIKFYTEEGNYDLVGNNTPVFFLRDAIKFPDFIHTQKRNPQTNAKDPDAFWDFLSLTPEALHQVTILFSSRGTPKTYRHMDGFGSHTFKWINAEGKAVWVKYHFKTAAGIENWTNEEATYMAGANPDFATLDLFNHIESGNEAVWNAFVQIMPIEDASNYRFDPFDVTKVWSHKDYPLIPIGRLVLNRNPENYFAEVEQAAFAPTNIVPGIGFSPDKMLQGRIFAYPDAHRYRVGTNYEHLPINRPLVPVNNYRRDGAMRFDGNGGASSNYEPNTTGGPKAAPEFYQGDHQDTFSGTASRHSYELTDNDFQQPGDLYRLMSAEEKTHLVNNLVGHLSNVKNKATVERQLKHFYRADSEFGQRIATGLGLEVTA